MSHEVQIVVIGAGASGMATAARVSEGRTVCVLERQTRAARYGVKLAPARWDWAWIEDVDAAALAWAGVAMGEGIGGVTAPKGMLHLFEDGWNGAYREMLARGNAAGSGVAGLKRSEVAKLFPYVNSARCAAALYQPPGVAGATDLDRIYRLSRTALRRNGGQVHFGEWLEEAGFADGVWTVRTNKRVIKARALVNCAGAWADDVARRCGTRRIGLRSSRSVGMELSLGWTVDSAWPDWPFLVSHTRAGLIMCDFRRLGRVAISVSSPDGWSGQWDGTATVTDVASALSAFEAWTNLRVDEASGPSWSWIRSWTNDRRPTIGWANDVPSFFWVAGLDSTGPESVVAISALASDMICNKRDFWEQLARAGVKRERFSPSRLVHAGVAA